MRRFARLLLVEALMFSADLFGNNPATRITEAIDYMIKTLVSAKK